MTTLKQKLLSGVALLALLETSGAMAASPVPTWTGFYFGGQIGYSWGKVDGDTTRSVVIPPASAPNFWVNNPVRVPFVFARDLDPQGWLGGLQAGYNFQVERIVYGFETDFTWTGQDDTIYLNGDTRPKFVNTEDFSYKETTSAKLRYVGTVRGRLGYTVGNFLPYVTGGFAWGRMLVDTNWRLHQFNQIANLSFAESEAHTHVGWTLGAGFEYAFAEHWSVKAEYLFIDLSKETYFAGVQGGGSFGMQDHTVRFGINFRP